MRSMASASTRFRMVWKPAIFWIIVVFNLGLTGCRGSRVLETPAITTGRSPTPFSSVNYELSGHLNAEGVLIDDLELTSSDGQAILSLVKGTKLIDESGQPIGSITITTSPQKADIEYSVLSSPTYVFDPRGAILEPPGQLTITYDPPPDFQGIDTNDPQIGASVGESTFEWEVLEVKEDPSIRSARAKINRLGSYIVFFFLRLIS